MQTGQPPGRAPSFPPHGFRDNAPGYVWRLQLQRLRRIVVFTEKIAAAAAGKSASAAAEDMCGSRQFLITINLSRIERTMCAPHVCCG